VIQKLREQRSFQHLLANSDALLVQQLELFALLNLGIVQSLASGVMSATAAVARFYHAENCLYVRQHLRNRWADAIMSRGVQLPDLFDALPAEEAQREFYHELEIMRALCLKLLERKVMPVVAGEAMA
jgi:hypothetical protein